MVDTVYLALFKEDQINQASEAVTGLRRLGIRDKEISIISGIPYSEKILGRPMSWTRVPLIAILGAGGGLVTALTLTFGTVYLYPLRVGGQPFYAIPTSIVVIFELTMLGLMLSTFLGVFIETISPSFGPKGYHPKISDGQIAILFECPQKLEQNAHKILSELGAEIVHQPEVKNL